MKDKYARSYQQGDMVFVKWRSSGQWISGRVIAGEPHQARVAVSVPAAEPVNWGTRWLPINTPVFRNIKHDSIYFVAAEPSWNPHAVEPFLSPDEYRFLGGDPKRPHPDARRSSQMGAYMPATHYVRNDPVWVWEDGWHRAVVTSVSRSWVSVRMTTYRDRNGNGGKSFRPPFVWPAINDFPAPMTYIFADPTFGLVETRPGFYAAVPSPTA